MLLVKAVFQNGNVVLGGKSGSGIEGYAEMARYVRPGTTWLGERRLKE